MTSHTFEAPQQSPEHTCDHKAVTDQGLTAAGVPAQVRERFASATDAIVHSESAWNRNALTAWGQHPGPLLADDAPESAQRGLSQLSMRLFMQHHVTGTSTNIYDPVASIAALWRFIAAEHAVDLSTGAGLDAFCEFWRTHRTTWWDNPRPHAHT